LEMLKISKSRKVVDDKKVGDEVMIKDESHGLDGCSLDLESD
jgi:hypothetical protein